MERLALVGTQYKSYFKKGGLGEVLEKLSMSLGDLMATDKKISQVDIFLPLYEQEKDKFRETLAENWTFTDGQDYGTLQYKQNENLRIFLVKKDCNSGFNEDLIFGPIPYQSSTLSADPIYKETQLLCEKISSVIQKQVTNNNIYNYINLFDWPTALVDLPHKSSLGEYIRIFAYHNHPNDGAQGIFSPMNCGTTFSFPTILGGAYLCPFSKPGASCREKLDTFFSGGISFIEAGSPSGTIFMVPSDGFRKRAIDDIREVWCVSLKDKYVVPLTNGFDAVDPDYLKFTDRKSLRDQKDRDKQAFLGFLIENNVSRTDLCLDHSPMVFKEKFLAVVPGRLDSEKGTVELLDFLLKASLLQAQLFENTIFYIMGDWINR